MSAIILANWGVILGVFALLGHAASWPLSVVAFLVIAVQQHCLGLWMHEGGHWLLARNRSINDALVILFLSGPLYVPLNAYRNRHLLHHRHLGTARDTKPVIFSRLDGRHFAWFVLKTCLGLQFAQIAVEYFWSPRAAPRQSGATWRRDVLPMAAVQVLLFAAIAALASWQDYVWFWFLPWLTVNRFVAGLRSVIEHQPLAGEAHPFVRPLAPTWVDRLVFCRAGFEYHWLHHLHPNVPCFNLHRLDGRAGTPGERLSYTGALWRLMHGAAPAA